MQQVLLTQPKLSVPFIKNGCPSSFCNPIFASKTVIFEITFLAGSKYPDLHHSQGGLKFATQISPLLNCKVDMKVFNDFLHPHVTGTIIFADIGSFKWDSNFAL